MSAKPDGFRNYITAAALTAALVGAPIAASAQMGAGMMERERGPMAEQPRHGHGPGMMMGPGMGMMGPGMGMAMGMSMMGPGMSMMDPTMLPDLSAEQRQELRSMQRDLRRQHMEAMIEMMDARDEMMDEMLAEEPDPGRIREIHDRMARMHGDMLEARIEMRNRMHGILTEEQRERMREMQRGPARGMGPEGYP